MNFHPQEVPLTRSQPLGPTNLQIEDLNSLIDSLKRREENIIQLLDYNLKFKNSTNHMDVVHLRGLYIQLGDRERKRIEHEDATILKYLDFHINDEYQKKLLTKMKNKISQLYASAKDKLLQLGIFTQAKQAYLGISTFEETLGLVLSQFPIDVHFFLNCLIHSSRKRFSDEIEQDTLSPEGLRQKSLETSLANSRQLDNTLPKMILQKTASPVPNKEEGKPRENFRVRNIDPSSISAKELSKMARSSATVKSVDSRPSFDFKEDIKAAYDMLGVQKSSYSNYNNDATTRQESNVESETIEEQEATPPSDNPNENPSYRDSSLKGEQDPLVMSINLNQSSLANERAMAGVPNISSRAFGGKKVKVASNIKKSICVEEKTEPQVDKKDAEVPKVNKDAWLKNYDILKIEYTPLPTATKKETKKLLMEKVYKELWSTNTDIKRTIKKYRNKYLLSIGKKPLDSAEDRMNDSCDSDTNRAKSLTPKTHNNNFATTAPSKPKVSAFNPGQKSIFYVDNTRDIDNAEIGAENFSMQSYTPNGSINQLRQSRDSTKKPTSNKYLVLPKLNLFPEANAQIQNSFQCWPSANQNIKPLKPNFMIDLGNKTKFEKYQKGTDRPINNLIIDAKDVAQQEMLNMSLGSQTNGGRALSTYSNKNLYPLALNPLESIPTVNKVNL